MPLRAGLKHSLNYLSIHRRLEEPVIIITFFKPLVSECRATWPTKSDNYGDYDMSFSNGAAL